MGESRNVNFYRRQAAAYGGDLRACIMKDCGSVETSVNEKQGYGRQAGRVYLGRVACVQRRHCVPHTLGQDEGKGHMA